MTIMVMMMVLDSRPRWLFGFVAVWCFTALLFECASSARDFPRSKEIVVEQSLFQCWLELSNMYKIVIKSLMDDMATMPDDISLEPELLTTKNLQNVIYNLPPHCQKAISICLEQPTYPLCASSKVLNSKNWYRVCPESLLGWHDASRRRLFDHQLKNKPSSSAPSLDHASAPAASIPAPEPALASIPSPIPALKATSPKESPIPTPSVPKPYYYILPPESNDIDVDASIHSTVSEDKQQSEKSNINEREIVGSVVVIGAVSFLFAGLLLCNRKFHKNNNDSIYGPRDDKPLLSLSISDFSNGSSHKSYGFGSGINKDTFETMPFKTDLSQNSRISSIQMSMIDNGPSDSLPRIPHSSPATSTTLDDKPTSKLFSSSSPPPPSPILPLVQNATLAPHPPTKPSPSPPPPPPKPGPSPPPPPPKPGSSPTPPPPKIGPRPPPPPKGPRSTNVPSGLGQRKPLLGPNQSKGISGQGAVGDVGDQASKAKLKPFFWDKVLANPDQSMVWHEISSGSFQFNEAMIETLFGYNSGAKGRSDMKKDSTDASIQIIRILEPKKSQNIAILLKALNVTRQEVCDALMEGNELPNELLHSLLKMAPTSEEELKLRLYNDDISQLGVAERFLKALVEIPFAFKRIDALLLMGTLQDDISSIKESFITLEVACNELKSSRLFLKLLEAVLKTGNRMNDGTYRGGAQAFKLDTLLKLADVKGIDGKTTLLLFVVQETIRYEGMRAARMARDTASFSSLNSDDLIDDSPVETGDHIHNLGLEVVSSLGDELEHVKKAAALDVDALTSSVASLGYGLVKTKEFLNKEMKSLDENSGFHHSLDCFVEHAEIGITKLLEDEKRVRALVKSTTDYFHGNTAKDEGLRLFVIVRDFIRMLDKVCREVRQAPKKVKKASPAHRETPTAQRVSDPRQLLFPAIKDQRIDTSSSDEADS